MLTELINNKRKKQENFLQNQLKKHKKHLNHIKKVKKELEILSEGKLIFEIRKVVPTETNLYDYNFPDIQISNLSGCITISNGTFNENGDLVEVGVSSLTIFPLSGTRISVKQFFSKIVNSYNF